MRAEAKRPPLREGSRASAGVKVGIEGWSLENMARSRGRSILNTPFGKRGLPLRKTNAAWMS